MATDAFVLEGKVILNDTEVLNGLDKVDKKAKETGDTMDNVGGKSNKFSSILKGLGGTIASTFALGKVKSFADECVAGANVQIMAETKLRNNLIATGKATQSNVEELKQYASQLQKVGVIGDEVGMAGMSQLATFNLTSDSIKTLSDGMYNLAVNQKGVNATQEDMMGYANMIGKAMQGQATALTRVGVTMTDAQAKIIQTGTEMERASVIADVLKANYGDLNKEIANTPQGKHQQLMNDLGDLKEVMGTLLLPIVSKLVEWIQQLVNWFNSLNPTTQKVVMVTGLLVALLPSLLGLFASLATLAGGLGISIGAIAGPIVAVIAVVAGLVTVGIALYKNWDTVKEKASEIFGKIKDIIGGAIDKIKGFFKFDWEFPKLKMPHFKLEGKFSLMPPSVPKLGVDWYSSGAIFTKKTILPGGIGVGDANKGQGNNAEGIFPLDKLESWIKSIADRPIKIYIDGKEAMMAFAPYQDIFEEYNNRFAY